MKDNGFRAEQLLTVFLTNLAEEGGMTRARQREIHDELVDCIGKVHPEKIGLTLFTILKDWVPIAKKQIDENPETF